MGKYYLSKNYKETSSAGNKAKTDIESIMQDLGYQSAGFRQTTYKNSIVGFFITLAGVLKVPFTVGKGDILVLQYPFKKFYSLVCRFAHWRGCQVITIVHDLGSFRRKKLTVEQEIKRLSHTDYLIVHNQRMYEWLIKKGFSKPMGCLGIFDYLSDTRASEQMDLSSQSSVIYAGGLSYKKNRFLYLMDECIQNWKFNLYGGGFEKDRIKNQENFIYRGFVPSDQLIASVNGGFGLVWDGESTETCTGSFGEYLKFNNPHKTSLYIRCHLPVIIWKKAALASFVEENKIGFSVSSLSELNELLPAITEEKYQEMRGNAQKISNKLKSGFYLTSALQVAENKLSELI